VGGKKTEDNLLALGTKEGFTKKGGKSEEGQVPLERGGRRNVFLKPGGEKPQG